VGVGEVEGEGLSVWVGVGGVVTGREGRVVVVGESEVVRFFGELYRAGLHRYFTLYVFFCCAAFFFPCFCVLEVCSSFFFFFFFFFLLGFTFRVFFFWLFGGFFFFFFFFFFGR